MDKVEEQAEKYGHSQTRELAFLVAHSGQYDYSAGALGAYTIKTAVGKTGLSFMRALFSGILCNILVCAAVLMAAAAKEYWRKSAGDLLPDPGLCSIWL